MDEVVIAGISGRLPESSNLEEFWENLINGVDMVTEDDRRWKPGKISSSCVLVQSQSQLRGVSFHVRLRELNDHMITELICTLFIFLFIVLFYAKIINQ